VHDDHRVGAGRAEREHTIVDRADMLGLAQLYQLRGRVGRSAERAFAYFFFPEHREMTGGPPAPGDDREAQALGSGFKIALRSEIRGARLLGAEQSGHIVGRVRRLCTDPRRVGERARGAPVEQESELRIDLPVKVHPPGGSPRGVASGALPAHRHGAIMKVWR
jgi:transcription-repair coupling factor (superfamily II helicase)